MIKHLSRTFIFIALFNQHGQHTYQSERWSVSMDLRNVAKGIYVLKIQTTTGVATKRVVRQQAILSVLKNH